MKKNILIKILGIVAFLSLFVTACKKEPENQEFATIESTDLPKSFGEDVFAGKTFNGKNIYLGFNYEFDNEGNVIYSEKIPYDLSTAPYVKIAKYKYAYTPRDEKKGFYYSRIHFKPIGYYIDDVLYTDSDEYVNKLITDITNDSITVSDEYTEALKKIYKYQYTSTKMIRLYTYTPDDTKVNLSFAADVTIRNISNISNTKGTDISNQLINRSFKTKLGVSSTKCAFVFTDSTEKECLKELDFQIYECTKNKAKVVCTYLDESTGGDDNSESSAEYKVAGYGEVKVVNKTEWVKIPDTDNQRAQKNYAIVKITNVDDSLKEYITKALADISGTGEGLDASDILDKEFQINPPAEAPNMDYYSGMLQ